MEAIAIGTITTVRKKGQSFAGSAVKHSDGRPSGREDVAGRERAPQGQQNPLTKYNDCRPHAIRKLLACSKDRAQMCLDGSTVRMGAYGDMPVEQWPYYQAQIFLKGMARRPIADRIVWEAENEAHDWDGLSDAVDPEFLERLEENPASRAVTALVSATEELVAAANADNGKVFETFVVWKRAWLTLATLTGNRLDRFCRPFASRDDSAAAPVPSLAAGVELTEDEGLCVDALIQLKAWDSERPAKRRTLCQKAKGKHADEDVFKHQLVSLTAKGLIASKDGCKGGIHFTPKGRLFADARQKKSCRFDNK